MLTKLIEGCKQHLSSGPTGAQTLAKLKEAQDSKETEAAEFKGVAAHAAHIYSDMEEAQMFTGAAARVKAEAGVIAEQIKTLQQTSE